MSLARRWFGEGICLGGAVLFVLLALPVVALATILLRAVLLVAAAVGGVGLAVAYCANARFRSWLGGHLALLGPMRMTSSVPVAPGRE